MAEGMTPPMTGASRQRTAPTCLAIRIVTGIVLVADAGLLIGSFRLSLLIPIFLIMTAVTLVCYVTAPVAFSLEHGALVVTTRMGSRSFGLVMGCSRLDRKPGLTLRLWGNGGLFAGTGIFWNRSYDVFRAYVTAGTYADYVLVETQDKKVLISPEDPAAFVQACTAGLHS
jgi:hypothetical protein